MNIKNHIPNFLTCSNLVCGCFGVVFCLEGRAIPAAYFVWASAFFDFFDGFAARQLKVNSPIGKELDSLADVISFGLLPALVMYKMIGQSTTHLWLPYLGFMIAVFSALRLAIFNVDETQRESFKGLNTPANTLFITSLPLLSDRVGDWLYQDWLLAIITIVFSLLMVSPIQFFAFKFKNFSWNDNKAKFTFVGISVLLLAIFQVEAIPLIILFYILSSFINQSFGLEKTS
jgi:CDP-diacylglycerol---serine O-phosphatidyltransferase